MGLMKWENLEDLVDGTTAVLQRKGRQTRGLLRDLEEICKVYLKI